ncbi:MAG: hypothetical protein CMC65_07985 [Flavobacteriaceae bacterium]|nr:hypothetical protein [Flavobacteriaceae bacterium]|tara:strand:+ start:1295 stop:4237 length:2943 start_codon:yes stop_codon:yes gene_type:complete
MALSPNLLQFKSSGVYRLEFDKSQTVNIPAETIRLVVGRSKKGPYNTPVLIEDVEQFIQVFGSIDKSLEKKNMFFHRSAIECLSRGPILALNLTTASDDDKVAIFSPATNSGIEGLASIPANGSNQLLKKYSEVFDTDKFWVPSDEKLLSVAGADENHAISFVNIKQDPISVIIRQAGDVRGFEVTAREWYGEANIPEGIEADEYVSDYMVDVFVFKGKFDAQALNNDPVYGEFFTSKGLEKDQLAKFVGLREVTLLAQYSGSMIPEFMDNEGRQLYIETLINLEARRTGLFCAIQEDELDSIDLVGNGFNVYQDYEVLSHRVEQTVTPLAQSLASFNGIAQVDGSTMTISGDAGFDVATLSALPNPIIVGKFLEANQADEYVRITNIQPGAVSNSVVITADGDISQQINIYEQYTNSNGATWNNDVEYRIDDNGNLVFKDAPDSVGDTLLSMGASGSVTYLLSENAGEYIGIGTIINGYTDSGVGAFPGSGSYLVPTNGGNIGFSSSLVTNGGILPANTPFLGKKPAVSTNFAVNDIELNARAVQFESGWTFEDLGAGTFKYYQDGVVTDTFTKDANGDVAIKVGMYVPGDGGKLSRIKKIVKSTANGGLTTVYTFETHRAVSNDPLYAYKRYEDAAGVYKMFPLDGASQGTKKIADLLTAIKPGTGLGNALVDKDNITFRYVIDTFGSLEDSGILNKEELSFLCKERQNASAILNAPMIKEFKASTNPSFLNEFSGAFDVNNVATGGNLNLNPSALYTLPSINEGATYAFYYGPGLNVIENGRTKVIPPAAYISNNYIDKFSDALPWSIIAGPRRGVVGGTGVQSLEFAFDKLDRDVLEPFGYNPIVFERGVGLTIKGNKTAQQGIQSALSSAHVREALIYIEDGLAEILKNYLFEFNTAQTRLEIKTLADSFMESVKKDGGVYDYRNIMDSTNNTNEVIDNNMGILDTFVEPVKGLEILVSRVTVLNTGEIASGNFA